MRYLNHWLATLAFVTGLALSSTTYADFTRIEEVHPSISYEGDWRSVARSGVSGGSAMAASAAGARVSVLFRGSSISWIGYRCSCTAGTARVYVDGALTTTAQSYASSPEAQSVIHTVSNLGPGPHTLTIELTGASLFEGGNSYMAIDAFDIENGAPLRQLQENDAAITYTGAWLDINDPGVSGGSVVATQEAGATATVRFTGNTVRWISYACPCTGGIAEISVDGQVLASATAWAETRQAQVPLAIYSTLADGDHEMTLRVTGASAAESRWVVVDAFQVDATGSDTSAPDVTLVSPGNDDAVTGMVTIEADADDDVGVTKVQFYAEPFGGSPILLGEDTTAPFTLTRDTSSIASGRQFRLTARAWDAANNYAVSPTVTVTVQHTGDTTPPVLAITAPANGATLSGTVNLSATATDDRNVASVRFIIDFLSDDYMPTPVPISQPPYTMPLNTSGLKDGFHKIVAMAHDGANNFATEEITVTVDNSVQPGSVRYDDDAPGITFNGAWTLQADGEFPGFHWDSAAVSTTPGATATFTFQGTGIQWHGFACAECGNATVSIDGGPPQQVATYQADRPGVSYNFGSVVYQSPALANGTHTLTITVQDAPQPGASRVYVDALQVSTN